MPDSHHTHAQAAAWALGRPVPIVRPENASPADEALNCWFCGEPGANPTNPYYSVTVLRCSSGHEEVRWRMVPAPPTEQPDEFSTALANGESVMETFLDHSRQHRPSPA
jgi:hypothetical protein